MSDLNQALFLLLNAPAAAPHELVVFALVAAKYLILLVPLHLLLVWTAGDRRLRYIALTSLLALILALGVNQIIGLAYSSPRPFVAGIGHTLLAHRPNSSFPSNHATVIFTYGAVLMVFGRDRLALVVGVVGCVVAWARIYLGVHYPLDMVGAAVVGGLAATTAVSLMPRWGAPLVAVSERIHRTATPLLVRTRVVSAGQG